MSDSVSWSINRANGRYQLDLNVEGKQKSVDIGSLKTGQGEGGSKLTNAPELAGAVRKLMNELGENLEKKGKHDIEVLTEVSRHKEGLIYTKETRSGQHMVKYESARVPSNLSGLVYPLLKQIDEEIERQKSLVDIAEVGTFYGPDKRRTKKPEKTAQIYLSYDSEDLKVASSLCNLLRELCTPYNTQIYFQADEPQDDEEVAIRLRALDAADIFMPLVTEDYARSLSWSLREFQEAVALRDKKGPRWISSLMFSSPEKQLMETLKDYPALFFFEATSILRRRSELRRFLRHLFN